MLYYSVFWFWIAYQDGNGQGGKDVVEKDSVEHLHRTVDHAAVEEIGFR